jgi:hypothetical protein
MFVCANAERTSSMPVPPISWTPGMSSWRATSSMQKLILGYDIAERGGYGFHDGLSIPRASACHGDIPTQERAFTGLPLGLAVLRLITGSP